jgi:hypothetical protein
MIGRVGPVVAVLLGLAVGSCGGATGTSTSDTTAGSVTATISSTSSSSTTIPEVVCVDPPEVERTRRSELEVAVEPNPVTAGSHVRLTIALLDTTSDATGGASAEWQCWNRSSWVGTHQLVRDWNSGGALTLKVAPGATTTVPAIGLSVPNTYTILVPDVPAGIYRIADSVFVHVSPVGGFAIVEVVGG